MAHELKIPVKEKEDTHGTQSSPGLWWVKELICCGFKSKAAAQVTSAVTISCKRDTPDLKPLLALLEKVPLMRKLTTKDREEVAAVCEQQIFPKGAIVISQGDIGREFFVISDGQAVVTKKTEDGSQKTIVTLRTGDYFGEAALLCDEPRIATVTSVEPLAVLKISRQNFRDLGLHAKLQFAKRKAVGGEIREIETKPPSPKTPEDVKFIRDALWRNENLATMLGSLGEDRVTELINVAWKEQVQSGDTVIKVGDLNADYFYVVQEGSFEVSDLSEGEISEGTSPKRRKRPGTPNGDSRISDDASPLCPERAMGRTVEIGDCFGELALLYLTQRTATVRAREDSILWVIDRQNFKRVLMEKSEERTMEYAKMLDSVSILNCLAEDEKKELANAFVEVQYLEGEEIIHQGTPGSTFYILYDGAVSVLVDGKTVKDLSRRGAYFGEKALLDEKVRTATVTVTSSKATVLALDHESFDLLLGSLADLMKEYNECKSNVTVRRDRGKSGCRSTMMIPTRKFTREVKYEDLKLIGLLGNGGFGCVELYQNSETNDTYALKSMSKGHIVKVGMQNAVVNERLVLMTCDSPFIVRLYSTYNWPKQVCFLMEVLLGGELYATYTRENLWGHDTHAKYYASVVISAFEHLHSHRILYRDLKPENIVLNAKGMPKLVDMGLAKRVVGKTFTTCGTPDYFAPEVITGSGHNHAVDWWTVGILIYELLAGNPPFTASAPMQIFKNVLAGIKRVSMPKKCQGQPGALIKLLLRKEPSERLPMRSGGVDGLKKHEWYSKFDWDALQREEMKPPYKPKVKSDTDIGNFSARPEDRPRQVTYVDDGSGWDLEFDCKF